MLAAQGGKRSDATLARLKHGHGFVLLSPAKNLVIAARLCDLLNVRFGSKADMCSAQADVC
jgi:hypothetical protein